MEFSVREFEPSDSARVRELSARLTHGFAPWRSPDRVRSTVAGWIDDAIERCHDDDRCIFVIEVAGMVVGFGSVAAQDHYIDGRDANIGEFAIDADYEGRRAGQMLLGAIQAWALEHGCGRVTLQTGAANQRARDFYERFGFQYEDVSMALLLPVTDR